MITGTGMPTQDFARYSLAFLHEGCIIIFQKKGGSSGQLSVTDLVLSAGFGRVQVLIGPAQEVHHLLALA
jgi:hypothetical protein